MNKLLVLTKTLPIVAKALADKLGVKVVIGGQTALTDGGTIVIPALKVDDEQVAPLAYGYMAHESGHVKHTDMECFSDTRPFHHKLLNIMEDIRIENLVMEEFPGSRRDLDVVTKRLDGGVSIADAHPASQVAMGIQLIGRARVLEQSVGEEADAAYDVLKGTLSAAKLSKLMAFIGMITGCSSTHELVSLRDRVLAMLQEPEEQEPPEENPDDQPESESSDQSQESDDESTPQGGDESNDSDEGEGKGESAGGTDTGDGESGGANASGSSGSGGEGDAQSESSAQSSAGGNGAGTSPGDAQQQIIEAILNASADDLSDVVDHSEALKEMLAANADSSENPSMALYGTSSNGSKEIADQVEAMAHDGMNGLRAVLNGLVQSTNRTQPYHKRAGNRVDSSRLSRVFVGDTRIFRKQVERQDVNTAVHMLADLSGSMGACYVEALSVVYGLGKVLQSIRGVNPAISAFPFAEQGVLAVRPLLKHGERMEMAHQRFGLKPSGGTPMAQSLWTVAASLVQQKEPRKVCLVVTDGDPDNVQAAKEIIDRCERAGIEMMAIAIGHKAPTIATLFHNHRVIGSVNELRTAMHEMVLTTLTRAA